MTPYDILVRCILQNINFLTLTLLFCLRVDSIMLLENNFKVTSTDASDKMLKQAWKIRWQRQKEEAFDNWGKFSSVL